jgi:lysophospholipase L1-like esterase
MLVGALWSAAPVEAASEPTSYYLSVGDSLAQGFQPIGGTREPGPPRQGNLVSGGEAAGYNQGYADQLLKLARDGGGEHLRLVKLGCFAESTATMIANSRCPYETGSQLGDAVEFLDEHPGEIAFITIDIGGNDFLVDCGGDVACGVQQVSANLPHILDTLREHAGPDVPIIGMNYPCFFCALWLQDPAAGEAAAANTVAGNNFFESFYAAAEMPVADVESAFAATDFTTLVELKGFGPVPLSVYNSCTLLWVCTGPPLGPDIHPNNDGYGVIAETFAAVLGV